MVVRRIREITVETEETIVIRMRTTHRIWCTECSGARPMAIPEAAAAFLSLAPREIYRRIEAGAAHFRELADGTLLVCLASLADPKPSRNPARRGPS